MSIYNCDHMHFKHTVGESVKADYIGEIYRAVKGLEVTIWAISSMNTDNFCVREVEYE